MFHLLSKSCHRGWLALRDNFSVYSCSPLWRRPGKQEASNRKENSGSCFPPAHCPSSSSTFLAGVDLPSSANARSPKGKWNCGSHHGSNDQAKQRNASNDREPVPPSHEFAMSPAQISAPFSKTVLLTWVLSFDLLTWCGIIVLAPFIVSIANASTLSGVVVASWTNCL